VNALIAWLKSKSYLSHSVAAGAILIATLISSDLQVRNFVLEIFKAHPTLGADIIALAAIILKYSHSNSPAGTVASAQVIMASPDPPTPAAVAAAQPGGVPTPDATFSKEGVK
jgi:hypothetical protein